MRVTENQWRFLSSEINDLLFQKVTVDAMQRTDWAKNGSRDISQETTAVD